MGSALPYFAGALYITDVTDWEVSSEVYHAAPGHSVALGKGAMKTRACIAKDVLSAQTLKMAATRRVTNAGMNKLTDLLIPGVPLHKRIKHNLLVQSGDGRRQEPDMLDVRNQICLITPFVHRLSCEGLSASSFSSPYLRLRSALLTVARCSINLCPLSGRLDR